GPGRSEREAVCLPGGRAAAGCGPPGRVPRPLCLRLRRGPRRSRLARRPRLGAAWVGRWRQVSEPDDGPARAARFGVRRPRDPPDPGWGVAVELLLLPGGASAAGVPVVLPPARSERARRRDRPGRRLSRLFADLDQPRLARARRSAVP